MDIQVVGSAESAAFYVCAYLCKSEPDDLVYALNALWTPKILRTHKDNGCCVLVVVF